MNAPIGIDEIPGPRGLPLLGNVFDIDAHSPLEQMARMAVEYGPLYKITTLGRGPAARVRPRTRRRDLRRHPLRL